MDSVVADDLAGDVDLPLLVAAYYLDDRLDGRLDDRSDALDKALSIIDDLVARPAWGRREEDGYSHNGDMGAAFSLQALAQAWHMLGDRLGDERRARMLEKLRLQGNIFLDLALINRDYWGGAIAQDHGFRSTLSFATAALCLYGVIPDAATWLAFVLPHLERILDAMPTDGVIPAASHYGTWLYLEPLLRFREVSVALGGEDILDRPVFPKIVSFLETTIRPEDGRMRVVGGGDLKPAIWALPFLNVMASKGAAGADRFARVLRGTRDPHAYKHHQVQLARTERLWDLLTYDPAAMAEPPAGPRRRLAHFEDMGFVHYTDDRTGLTLCLTCGPWAGYNAYPKVRPETDRLSGAPSQGHFVLYMDGEPRLVTPDAGYRLYSFLRSCMLVDGKGQRGDVGYPMSIPSYEHRGSRVVTTRWDPESGDGFVRLDLTPAYPEELDMLFYRRDFIIRGRGELVVRDHVAFGTPRRPSWLFQASRAEGMAMEGGLRCRVGERPCLRIEPRASGVTLEASVQETEVVWSYCSAAGYVPFDHVRYDAVEPALEACVDFVFTRE